MALPLPPINSRADLDGLDADTRAAWLDRLARTLWRLERDDANQRWVAVEDTSTIERYGFTAADFPHAPKPEFPEWHPLPVEPAGIQNAVTMRQARHALLNAGLLDAVDAAIAAIPDETERRQAQIDWEYATEVRKDWPWVQTLSTALGLSEEQLDQLFIEASGL